MIVSGVAVVVFSAPGLALGMMVMTLGLGMAMAIPPDESLDAATPAASGRGFSLGWAKAQRLPLCGDHRCCLLLADAWRIDQARARLLPVRGPELTALAQPPRPIEIVARDW